MRLACLRGPLHRRDGACPVVATLLGLEGRAEQIARRERYSRGARIGETVVDAAECVVVAVVTQT